jgi:hypothetical protein
MGEPDLMKERTELLPECALKKVHNIAVEELIKGTTFRY